MPKNRPKSVKECFTYSLIHSFTYSLSLATDCYMLTIAIEDDLYGPLKSLNGTIIHTASDADDILTTNKIFIKAHSISCIGCKAISRQSAICDGPTIAGGAEYLSRYPYINSTDGPQLDAASELILSMSVASAFNEIAYLCGTAYLTFDNFSNSASCIEANARKYDSVNKNNSYEIMITMMNDIFYIGNYYKEKINLVVSYLFGFLGLVSAGFVLGIAIKVKEMRTTFGLMCAFIAAIDIGFVGMCQRFLCYRHLSD